jgi:hypothetical protein
MAASEANIHWELREWAPWLFWVGHFIIKISLPGATLSFHQNLLAERWG